MANSRKIRAECLNVKILVNCLVRYYVCKYRFLSLSLFVIEGKLHHEVLHQVG